MLIGTGSALLLIWLSPTVQVDVLGGTEAPFPLRNPAVITIPLSFLVGVVGSLATQRAGETETARFEERERQMLGT
jgi:cation/acetate symporter